MTGFVLLLLTLAAGLLLALVPGAAVRAQAAPSLVLEVRAAQGLAPELRRRFERYIERRTGGTVRAGHLALVLLCAFLVSGALLFPFFSLGAVLPAVLIAYVAGQLYLQAQEGRRVNALEEQTLELLTLAEANLSASARLSPARLIGDLLAQEGDPLREETAAIQAALGAGRDFLPALEDLMLHTRSMRLRRFLHLWRASEQEALSPQGQAARFRALVEQERLQEKLRQDILAAVLKAQSSMYIVMGIIPALVGVMMLMVPEFRNAYIGNPLGQLGLTFILAAELLVVILSRRIVARALR